MGVALPLAGGFLALDNAETWVLVAFIIFVGILVYAGVPRLITKALDDRAAAIREQLNEARKLREEAQRKLAEFERQHADVEREAAAIVDRAKREAEAAAVDAKAAIEASVAQRLQSAEDQIAMAEAEAVRAVRNQAVDAAISATRRVLATSVTAEHQSSLIDAAITDIASRPN